uniref:Uncharacterized protein n=1 Tax=Loa loa TaxID=7209 RepID=A0A1I7VGZ9_LOALO
MLFVGEAAKWKTVLQQLLKNLLLLCKTVEEHILELLCSAFDAVAVEAVEEMVVFVVIFVVVVIVDVLKLLEMLLCCLRSCSYVVKEVVVVEEVDVKKVVVVRKIVGEKGVVEFILKKSIAGGTAEVDVEMFIVEKEDVVVGIVGSGGTAEVDVEMFIVEKEDVVVGIVGSGVEKVVVLLKKKVLLLKRKALLNLFIEEKGVVEFILKKSIAGGTAEVDVEMFIVEKEDVLLGLLEVVWKRKALLNLFIEEKGVVEFILKKSIAGGTAEVDVEMFIVEKEDVVVGIVGSGVEKVKALIGRKSHIKSK